MRVLVVSYRIYFFLKLAPKNWSIDKLKFLYVSKCNTSNTQEFGIEKIVNAQNKIWNALIFTL